MEYNPLKSQVRSRMEAPNKLRTMETELRLKLAWSDAFDPAAMAKLVTVEQANITNPAIQLDELESNLARSRDRVEDIRPATPLGWDPSYWFSEARSAAMREVAQQDAEIKKREADQRRYAGERAGPLTHLADVEESLVRYSQFDCQSVAGNITRLEAEIGRSRAELDNFETREKASEG